MCDEYNYNDLNLDFLDMPHPVKNALPSVSLQMQSMPINFSRQTGAKELAKRIADTDTLIEEVRQLRCESAGIQLKLQEFQDSAKEIQKLYEVEKKKSTNLENQLKGVENLDRELALKSFACEQLQEQCEKLKSPFSYDELSVKFLKLANKVEDKVALNWHDKKFIAEIKQYCLERDIIIPESTTPRERAKRKERVREANTKCTQTAANVATQSVQCDLWQQPQELESSKQLTCSPSLQCINTQIVANVDTSLHGTKSVECDLWQQPQELETSKQLTSSCSTQTVANVETSSQVTQSVQCDIWQQSPALKPSKALTCSRSTQCISTIETRSQGTQHISSTTTRSTSTSAFIKQHHVGTNFPEYLPLPSFNKIMEEVLEWVRISPVGPIEDLSLPEAPLALAITQPMEVQIICPIQDLKLPEIAAATDIIQPMKLPIISPIKDLKLPDIIQPMKVPIITPIKNLMLPETAATTETMQNQDLPQTPAAPITAQPVKVTLKTTGSCTYLCNVQRQIDFIPLGKRSSMWPQANPLFDPIKEEPQQTTTSTSTGTFLPFAALANIEHSVFDDLWRLFGHVFRALLQHSNQNIESNNARNTSGDALNQYEFINWLSSNYGDLPTRKSTQSPHVLSNDFATQANCATSLNDSTDEDIDTEPPQSITLGHKNFNVIQNEAANVEINSNIKKVDENTLQSESPNGHSSLLTDNAVGSSQLINIHITDTDNTLKSPREELAVIDMTDTKAKENSLEIANHMPEVRTDLQIELFGQSPPTRKKPERKRKIKYMQMACKRSKRLQGKQPIIKHDNSLKSPTTVFSSCTESDEDVWVTASKHNEPISEIESPIINELNESTIVATNTETKTSDDESEGKLTIDESNIMETSTANAISDLIAVSNLGSPNLNELIIDFSDCQSSSTESVSSFTSPERSKHSNTNLEISGSSLSPDITAFLESDASPQVSPTRSHSPVLLDAKECCDSLCSLDSFAETFSCNEPSMTTTDNSNASSNTTSKSPSPDITASLDDDDASAQEPTRSPSPVLATAMEYDSPSSPVSSTEALQEVSAPPKQIPLTLIPMKHQNRTTLLPQLIGEYNNKDRKKQWRMFNTKERLAHQNLTGKLKAVIGNFFKADSPISEDAAAFALVDELHHITDNNVIIAEAIIKQIETAPRPEKELDCAIVAVPPKYLSGSHRRMEHILRHLYHKYPLFTHVLLTKIDATLFSCSAGKQPTLNVALNLTELYLLILSKLSMQVNPARIFIAKCFYCYPTYWISMVYEVLCWFPTVLPHLEERSYDRSDALITVLQHLLVCNTYDMNQTTLRSKELLSKLRFEYHFKPFSPTRNEVIANLLEKLEAGKLTDLPYAFALICTRIPKPILLADVLQAQLIPLVKKYYTLVLQSSDYDARAAALLCSISMILKRLPIETDVCSYILLFSRFLYATKRQQLQEAAVQAVIRLHRFGMVNAYNALLFYAPTYQVSPQTAAMLKTFIYRKDRSFWKSLTVQLSFAQAH